MELFFFPPKVEDRVRRLMEIPPSNIDPEGRDASSHVSMCFSV